jgi:hypothetical protein
MLLKKKHWFLDGGSGAKEVKVFYANTAWFTSTFSTAEEIAEIVTVPANAFVDKLIRIKFITSKVASFVAAQTIRVRINTAPTLTGSTVLATGTAGSSSTRLLAIQRHFLVSASNLISVTKTSSLVNDITSTTTGFTYETLNYNFTQPVYILFTMEVNDANAIMRAQTILIETT